MRFLREEGITNDLPTRRLKSPRGGKPLPKSLTIDEIEALLNQVNNATSPAELRDRAVIELLYAGGLRISEITTLNIDHVNFDNSTVRIFGKGSKERIVPVYDAAMDAIAEYLAIGRRHLGKLQDPEALFINARGKRITRQGLWLQIKKIALTAGVTKNLTPHMLRHSFASHLLNGGASLRHVQELLGHENIATTQIYTHLTSQHVRSEYDAAPPEGMISEATSPIRSLTPRTQPRSSRTGPRQTQSRRTEPLQPVRLVLPRDPRPNSNIGAGANIQAHSPANSLNATADVQVICNSRAPTAKPPTAKINSIE